MSSAPSATTAPTWIARHPLVAFTGLALTASYAALTLMILIERGMIPGATLPARIGSDMEEASSLVLVLVLAATTLTVTRMVDGPAGVRLLLRRAIQWRVGWRWWLTAVAAVPMLTVALALALGDELVPPSPRSLLAELLAAAIALALINVAEETTWAGFLQTRLQRRHHVLVAALLTAIPFALVHVPIRIVAHEISSPADVLPQLAVLLVLCIIIRTLLGGILRGAGNSVLLVAVAHMSFNRSNNVDGIAADLLRGEAQPLAALTAALCVALALLVALRGRLRATRGEQLDTAAMR